MTGDDHNQCCENPEIDEMIHDYIGYVIECKNCGAGRFGLVDFCD